MSKQYDIFDLTKFVLSFFIIAIHSALFQRKLYPWLRIAVPLYFIMESFFLFSKINRTIDNKKGVVINFVLRQIKLYGFWLVVLLPATLWYRKGWFSQGMIPGIKTFLQQMLFGSTFVASWFISASILAAIILYAISIRKNSIPVIVLICFIYALCCMKSSYYTVYAENSTIKMLEHWYTSKFCNPVQSFPVALFWMMIGKLFSDGAIPNLGKRTNYLIAIVSAICLYIEWKYVYALNGSYTNDCYFLLAPLSISIFSILKDIQIVVPKAKQLRAFSTITFALHGSIIRLLTPRLNQVVQNRRLQTIGCFVITSIVCFLVCLLIQKLEKSDKFSIIRYSH